MASIEIHQPHPERGAPAIQILFDGVDLSDHVFTGADLVVVGDEPELAEIGLQVTFAISPASADRSGRGNQLLINGEPVDVSAETFDAVRERVRAAATPSDLELSEVYS